MHNITLSTWCTVCIDNRNFLGLLVRGVKSKEIYELVCCVRFIDLFNIP